MNHLKQLATKSLKEIQEVEKKLKALESKKLWIEKVKKDPQNAANLYFEVFDHLVQHYGNDDKDWEKLGLLLHFKIDPLSVKNKDGLNPFEYFYKKNREERLSLYDLPKKHHFLMNQNDSRYVYMANVLYYDLKNFGFNDEQLAPIHKVQNLWNNYQRLIYKEGRTNRVAFARLLKTVVHHPEDAVSVDDLKQMVVARLKREGKDEKQAWKEWEEWAKKDYRAQFSTPQSGHARGYSPLKSGGYCQASEGYFLNKPLPDSSQKALEDFLLSLKDLDASLGLTPKDVLPEKLVKAYKRALNPPKQFERVRYTSNYYRRFKADVKLLDK